MSLTLGRKVGETIILRGFGPEDIVLSVARIGPGSVRITVDAPISVNIIRGELYFPPEQDNQEPSKPQQPQDSAGSKEQVKLCQDCQTSHLTSRD